MNQLQERILVLKNIEECERQGKFNDDVEQDSPSKTIMPEEIDYLNKKLKNKIATFFANKLGKSFFESMKKHDKLIIKEVRGLENLNNIKGGAIITCNHFNLADNYIVYTALKPFLGRQKLYKVIKESNYTNFKGFVKFIMRHCNTLPLSSNLRTMTKFHGAIDHLLKKGKKILIFPEKAMWWNYKKPRPMLDGAFKIACKNEVPIIPIFITMENSKSLDENGFPVQEHTVHIMPAIYKQEKLSNLENVKAMKEANYLQNKTIYENFYQTKL